MPEGKKLFNPTRLEDPSVAQQIFELCTAAAEQAGGYLVPHPDEHAINVVFAGHQVTITVEGRDRHH